MNSWTSFWRRFIGGIFRKPTASGARRENAEQTKRRPGAGQTAAERFLEEFAKSSPYQLSFNDQVIRVEMKSRQDMTSEISWEHVLCAAVETKPVAAGLCVISKSPPYNHFWPTSCDGLQDLTNELQRRELIRTMSEASEISKRFVRAQLKAVLERRFGGQDQQKAKQLLQQCKTDDTRVLLAAAQLSGGDLKKLRKWVDLANQDFRDVLSAAWHARKNS